MYQLKVLIVSSLYHLKFFDILRQFQKKRVIILMYHRFSQKPEPFKIQQSVFENQIKFLKKKYNFISLKHYTEVLNGKRDDLPNNPLIITIDDGYRDNYTYAYPVLKKYNIPATIFLVTDFISKKAWLWSNKLEYILKNSAKLTFIFPLSDKDFFFSVNSFSDWHHTQLTIFNALRKFGNEKDQILVELSNFLRVKVPEETTSDFKSLDWQDIIEMQKFRISFASHTCSHPILSTIDKLSVRSELADSKFEIEAHLGRPVDVICYPNGKPEDIPDDVEKIAKDCGYLAGVTTVPASNLPETTNKFYLNRCELNTCNPMRIVNQFVRLPQS